MAKGPEFFSLIGANGETFFSYNVSLIEIGRVRPSNASTIGINYCTFLDEEMPISRHVTGPFSLDLTARDDIILAILSVTLILLIESILTSILLRTDKGRVDSFAFSIKYFIELVRGLKFSNLMTLKRKGESSKMKGINFKLLLVAGLVLFITFGLELFILFLTTPQLRPVYNVDNTFQIRELEIPDWNNIQRKMASAFTRPCATVTLDLDQLEQGTTQISTCVSLNRKTESFRVGIDGFSKADTEVEYTIESHVHEFGGEHIITINENGAEIGKAKYLVRAYFVLHDDNNRIMTKRRFFTNFEERVEMLHKQYFAYLFSQYLKDTNDNSINLDYLNSLNFNFTTQDGPVVNIVQIQHRQRFRRVASTKHVTKVKGRIPKGSPALEFAQAVFKGAYGIGLSGPDRWDLILGTGQTPSIPPSIVWHEVGRTLNWRSLLIAVCVAALILCMLRASLKPAGTAEIAFLYFADTPGASGPEVPLRLSPEDASHFQFSDFSGELTNSISEQSTTLSEYSE